MKFLENYFPMFLRVQVMTIEEYKEYYQSTVDKALLDLNLESKTEEQKFNSVAQLFSMIGFFYSEQYKIFGKDAYFMFDIESLRSSIGQHLYEFNFKQKENK